MFPTDKHSEEEITSLDFVVTPDVSEHQSSMHFTTMLTSTETNSENPPARDCSSGAGLWAEAGPRGALAVNESTVHGLLPSRSPDADASSAHFSGSSWAATSCQENTLEPTTPGKNFCWGSDADSGSSAGYDADRDDGGLTSDSDAGGAVLNNTNGSTYKSTVFKREPTPTSLPAMEASPPTHWLSATGEITYPTAVAAAEEAAASVIKERGGGGTTRMPHFAPHDIDLRIRTSNRRYHQQRQNQHFHHTERREHTHHRPPHTQSQRNFQHHQAQLTFAPTSAYQGTHSPHVPLSSRVLPKSATAVYAFADGGSRLGALSGAGGNASANFLQGRPFAQSWCPSAKDAATSGKNLRELWGALGPPPSAALGAPVANDAHVRAHAHLHTHPLATPSGAMGDLVLSQLDATSHPQGFGMLQCMDGKIGGNRVEQSANRLGDGSHTYMGAAEGGQAPVAASEPGLAHAHFHEHVHVHALAPASASASGSSSRSKRYTTKGVSGARGRAHSAGGGNGGRGVGAGDSGGGGGRRGGGGGARKKVRKHFCSTCHKVFTDKYSLKVHNRTHTGEKPFPCLICKGRFRQKAHLTKHHKRHAGKKTGV